VQINHQFLDNRVTDTIYTNNGIAYKNISAYDKSGRIILSSRSQGFNSKEYDITVYPTVATNFDITANRVHNYADGNQLTTLSTSVLRDTYGNIVSDGTLVYFTIENNFGNKTTTTATTINGIAKAKVLHPTKKENWIINASVSGFANSNTIDLLFEQAVSDFEIAYKNESKSVLVGPIQSFMKQSIPDGLDVSLTIYNKDSIVYEKTTQSMDGIASFNLKKVQLPKGRYDIKIETAGIIKHLTGIAL